MNPFVRRTNDNAQNAGNPLNQVDDERESRKSIWKKKVSNKFRLTLKQPQKQSQEQSQEQPQWEEVKKE